MWEMFDFGLSVNFVQAANPTVTAFMIYMGFAPRLGGEFYKQRNNTITLIAFSIFFLLPMLMPQLIVSYLLWRNMEEIPQSLIDAGLYEVEEEKIPKQYLVLINLTILVLSVVASMIYIKIYA
jgi:hypothetical protein